VAMRAATGREITSRNVGIMSTMTTDAGLLAWDVLKYTHDLLISLFTWNIRTAESSSAVHSEMESSFNHGAAA
jgi:hypothetical protein